MNLSDKTIANLTIKLILVLSPLLLLISATLALDPLKVFGDYQEYYKGNFVTVNRELVCLKLYNRNSKNLRYDSFIFGSSRSEAFKIVNWLRHLPPGAQGFHFDAYGDGLYGIYNKMRYIDETGGTIKNALIVLDLDTLKGTKNRKGFLLISPPELSKESKISFYLEIIKPFFEIKFALGYLDFTLLKTYRDYMSWYFNGAKYDHVSNNTTGDIYYGYDKMISDSKDAYYKSMIKKGLFYDRKTVQPKKYPVNAAEVELLTKIKLLLTKHKTSFKIVISPIYDQIKLEDDQLKLLTDLFGKNVYDFSGVNKFTNSIYNYYEESHYRPHVADEIMQTIYSQDQL